MKIYFQGLAGEGRRANEKVTGRKARTGGWALLNNKWSKCAGDADGLADQRWFCRMRGNTERAANGRISGFRFEMDVTGFADSCD